MPSQTERIKWLDIARTLAIILVILNHTVELTYFFSLEGWHCYSIEENIFKTTLFSLGRLGVPLFLSISGVLLLNKPFDTIKNIFYFYQHNLISLLISAEIWSIFYFLFFYFYYGEINSCFQIIKGMLFMENVPIAHMWYIPMIIGIYTIIPFLAYILQALPIKVFYFPITISFISFVFIPSLNIFLSALGIENIFFYLDTSFLGGVYGLYLICGYFIGKGIFSKCHTWILFLLNGLFLIFTIWTQSFAYQHSYVFNTWYSFIGTFINGLLLFELIRRSMYFKFPLMLSNLFAYISKISLALFFLHMPVLISLQAFISSRIVNNIFNVLILWLLGGGISIVIITILSNIKLIRKYILVIK